MNEVAPSAKGVTRQVRVAAVFLIAALIAGPGGTHLYWLLGGTWGLGGADSSTGIRLAAAMVVLLIVAAVLVVLARVGWLQQSLVSERVIRFLAWGLAAFYLVHGLLSFAEGWAGANVDEWWLYGPGGLVIGLLALILAGSGGGRPHLHRPHRMLPSH